MKLITIRKSILGKGLCLAVLAGIALFTFPKASHADCPKLNTSDCVKLILNAQGQITGSTLCGASVNGHPLQGVGSGNGPYDTSAAPCATGCSTDGYQACGT